MAFSVSNVQSGMLFGSMKVYMGTYSGSVGDAPGTISLGGGEVYFTAVQDQGTASPTEDPDYSVSITGNAITVTIYNHTTVSRGRFFIIYS